MNIECTKLIQVGSSSENDSTTGRNKYRCCGNTRSGGQTVDTRGLENLLNFIAEVVREVLVGSEH